MREEGKKLLPAKFQEAGHNQPHLKEGACPPIPMDVHHAAVDVHAASLGGNRAKKWGTAVNT